MVNAERTKLMTKAEIFRVKEERRALKLNRFYRSDYISYEMIRSALCFIFGYVLVVVMWVLYYAEPLMTTKQIEELVQMAVQAGVVLLCLLACFLVVSYFVFRRKYRKARAKVKDYQALLKQINHLYEQEAAKVWKESEEFKA
jgi:cbb3-type cytochrome oxidase subunit 3